MNGYTLGRQLRQTRESHGLTLDDAVENLRIRRAVLEAFELGDFDVPGASEVQVRGFVRNYARFLHLNEEAVLMDYEAALVDARKMAKRREDRRRARLGDSAQTQRAIPAVSLVRPPTPLPMPPRSRAARARRPRSSGGGGMVLMFVGMMVGSATLTGTFFLVLYLLYQMFPVIADDSGGVEQGILVPPVVTFTPAPGTSGERGGAPTVGVLVALEGRQNGWMQVTIDGRPLAARPIGNGERVEYVANTEIIVETSDAATFEVAYNDEQLGMVGQTGQPVRVVFSRDSFALSDDVALVAQPSMPDELILVPIVTPRGLDQVSRLDAPHTARFVDLKLNRPLTLFFYDVTNDEMLAGIDVDKQMPVVSAVKGPILMYFFDVVPEEIWNTVPVELWNIRDAALIPQYYRPAWDQHREILRDLYRMIVVSDNISTGNALRYAYDYYQPPGMNPIQAFNHWSMEVVGMSAESGMRQWDEGGTNDPSWIEPRFNTRMTSIYNSMRQYNNTYSALDLARFYTWVYTQAPRQVYQRTFEVMSIVEGAPGFLEDTAFRVGGTPVSKDGYVGPGARHNLRGEHLTADAGLILLNDRAYIVVTMGVDGGDRLSYIYGEILRVINQERRTLYWPSGVSFAAWVRSPEGPYEGRPLSVEGANFVLDYLKEVGQEPVRNVNMDDRRFYFDQARAVWFAFFPNDRVPDVRTPEQERVIAARYGGSGETIHQIAVELNYVRP